MNLLDVENEKKPLFDRLMDRHQEYYELVGSVRRSKGCSPIKEKYIRSLEGRAERYYSLAQKIKKGVMQ
jgi:hypothetical protein